MISKAIAWGVAVGVLFLAAEGQGAGRSEIPSERDRESFEESRGLFEESRGLSERGCELFEREWVGTQGGPGGPAEWVVTDAKEWADLWDLTHPEVPSPPVPSIDFSRSMVVGVALGQKPTGGYQVRISRIRRLPGELIVEVVSDAPAPGGMTLMAFTQPYHLVQIPSRSQKISFSWKTLTESQ